MVKNACELGAWVEGMIRDFVNESPENSLRNEAGEKAWGDPWSGSPKGPIPSTVSKSGTSALSS